MAMTSVWKSWFGNYKIKDRAWTQIKIIIDEKIYIIITELKRMNAWSSLKKVLKVNKRLKDHQANTKCVF